MSVRSPTTNEGFPSRRFPLLIRREHVSTGTVFTCLTALALELGTSESFDGRPSLSSCSSLGSCQPSAELSDRAPFDSTERPPSLLSEISFQ
jgi:hypothetical protein